MKFRLRSLFVVVSIAVVIAVGLRYSFGEKKHYFSAPSFSRTDPSVQVKTAMVASPRKPTVFFGASEWENSRQCDFVLVVDVPYKNLSAIEQTVKKAGGGYYTEIEFWVEGGYFLFTFEGLFADNDDLTGLERVNLGVCREASEIIGSVPFFEADLSKECFLRASIGKNGRWHVEQLPVSTKAFVNLEFSDMKPDSKVDSVYEELNSISSNRRSRD